MEYKTNLFGKAVLEKEHLKEVQKYIKDLESTNKELNRVNDSLEVKVKKLNEEVDEISYAGSGHYTEIEELKKEKEFLFNILPETKKLLELREFQEKVSRKGGFSENYYLDEAELASILELGSDVVDEFIENEKATLVLNDSEYAVLEFRGDSYEGAGPDSINIYTDYNLTVNRFDNENVFIRSYDIAEFLDKYNMKERVRKSELDTESEKEDAREAVNDKSNPTYFVGCESIGNSDYYDFEEGITVVVDFDTNEIKGRQAGYGYWTDLDYEEVIPYLDKLDEKDIIRDFTPLKEFQNKKLAKRIKNIESER